MLNLSYKRWSLTRSSPTKSPCWSDEPKTFGIFFIPSFNVLRGYFYVSTNLIEVPTVWILINLETQLFLLSTSNCFLVVLFYGIYCMYPSTWKWWRCRILFLRWSWVSVSLFSTYDVHQVNSSPSKRHPILSKSLAVCYSECTNLVFMLKR